MYQNVVSTYQQTCFNTANPIKLVLMCYDGAISSLKLAREFYKGRNYEAKAKALQKAVSIIHEMNISLDLEKGGVVAKNLRSLYMYMINTLTLADVNRNIDQFNEIIRMLEELESAWKEIASGAGKDRPIAYEPSVVERRTPSVSQAWHV